MPHPRPRPRPGVTRRRGLSAAIAAVIGALLLSGCASLGETGRVRGGLEIGGAEVPRVRVFFPGPVNGAAPEQIVRGFLRSGAASDGDYDTARSFLTPAAAASWAPDGDLLIFPTEGDLTVTMATETTAALSVPVVARITPDGRYVSAPTGETATAELTFERVEGEWRIASLPDGFARWLTVGDIPRLFQPYAVHYVAADRRALVRELRWFPLDHLASRLARAQLAPVPADLSGVVTTGVPSGTRLVADAVSVVGGVATVVLSNRPPADQVVRQNLWAQFVATLTQDPSVFAVSLQVDGTTIEPPGARAPVSDVAQMGFAPLPARPVTAPIVRRGERFHTFNPSASVSGQDPADQGEARGDLPVIAPLWVEVAATSDTRDLAAVSQDRSQLARWRGRDRFEVPPFATGLSAPTFDTRGHVWVGASASSAPAPGTAALFVINQGDAPANALARPVAADWLVGRDILALRTSPDDERVAILSKDEAGRVWLHVAGVVRNPSGLPVSLAQGRELVAGLSGLDELVWLNQSTLATLATPAGAATRPVVLSLDGTSMELPEVPGAVGLTSTDGERQLLVRTGDDRILVRAGQLWIQAGNGSQVLVPGH